MLTTKGSIDFRRNWFHCRFCGQGFNPLDIMLDLEFVGHKVTPEMTAKIAYAGQNAPSFEAAEQGFEYMMGLEISRTLIRQITEETGQKVHEQEMEEAEKAIAAPEEAISSLLPHERRAGTQYVLVDGSQVNTRHKDQAGSSWKEMKLALIYNDSNVIRRKSGQAVIVDKEYTAYWGDVNGFKKLVFNAALRKGYGTYEQVVFIGDGAHWIWNMCEELFPDAIQILDYYHMCENVYSYARYLYPSDDQKIKGWAEAVIAHIEENEIDKALALIPATDESRLPQGVPNLSVYLSNNRNRMNYKAYQQSGLNVGSGAIESGNKKIIQQRMKQSGMRWNVETGQTIASLRAKNASGKWCEVEQLLNVA